MLCIFLVLLYCWGNDFFDMTEFFLCLHYVNKIVLMHQAFIKL